MYEIPFPGPGSKSCKMARCVSLCHLVLAYYLQPPCLEAGSMKSDNISMNIACTLAEAFPFPSSFLVGIQVLSRVWGLMLGIQVFSRVWGLMWDPGFEQGLGFAVGDPGFEQGLGFDVGSRF